MNSLDHLQDLAAFVAVGELGSLTRAGARLGVPAAIVARRLDALEQWAGTRLATRTGRSLQLTPEGQRYFERARPLVAAVHSVYDEAVAEAASAQGRLVVAMPPDFGNSWISPLLANFIRTHPAIKLELELCAEAIDPSSRRVDLAIRVGPVQEQSLIARSLGSIPQHVYASPDYLARRPPLRHPDDLVRHTCIAWDSPSGGDTWRFRKGAEEVDVKIAGCLSTNHVQTAHRLVDRGHGVAALPAYPVALTEGVRHQTRVLVDWDMARIPVWALLPSRLASLKTRLFIDYLARALAVRFGH